MKNHRKGSWQQFDKLESSSSLFDRVAGMKLMNKTQIKRHIVKERLYSIQVRSLAGETPAYIERDSEWVCIQLFPLWLSLSSPQKINQETGEARLGDKGQPKFSTRWENPTDSHREKKCCDEDIPIIQDKKKRSKSQGIFKRQKHQCCALCMDSQRQ